MKHRSANVILCAIWLCAVAAAQGQAQAVTAAPDTHALDGAAPWPYLEPEHEPGDRRMRELDQPGAARSWIETDELPAAVRVRWQHRPELAPPPPADANGDPAPGYYERFSRVEVVGAFARVRSTYTAYYMREGYARPQGYAGGTTLYLLRTDGGWVVVDSTGWIT